MSKSVTLLILKRFSLAFEFVLDCMGGKSRNTENGELREGCKNPHNTNLAWTGTPAMESVSSGQILDVSPTRFMGSERKRGIKDGLQAEGWS